MPDNGLLRNEVYTRGSCCIEYRNRTHDSGIIWIINSAYSKAGWTFLRPTCLFFYQLLPNQAFDLVRQFIKREVGFDHEVGCPEFASFDDVFVFSEV